MALNAAIISTDLETHSRSKLIQIEHSKADAFLLTLSVVKANHPILSSRLGIQQRVKNGNSSSPC
jgi:hypothetical protein